jgi:hypothetical protein
MDGATADIEGGARLVEPTIELQAEFGDMVREWPVGEGTLVWKGALDDFPSFVQGLRHEAEADQVNPGGCPARTTGLLEGTDGLSAGVD